MKLPSGAGTKTKTKTKVKAKLAGAGAKATIVKSAPVVRYELSSSQYIAWTGIKGSKGQYKSFGFTKKTKDAAYKTAKKWLLKQGRPLAA